MEENYCPIENKYDRLAIIYIINLMSDELDKIESDNLDNLINDLNLTKTECEDFMSKNDVKSLTQYSTKFNNFTKDYLVTAINEVLFNNLPLSIEDNEFVNEFLVDNAGFTNGEFKRRNKKINLIVNHFVSQSDSNEIVSNSNEINKSNPIAKFFKIIALILFASFIGVMFKECYNGKKLFESNTFSNYEDFPTDSAVAIVDSAVLPVTYDIQDEVLSRIDSSNNSLLFETNNKNINEEKINLFIHDYYKTVVNYDYQNYYNIFAPLVYDFYNYKNVSVDEIISDNINYSKKWKYIRIEYLPNTLNVISQNDIKTIMSYQIIYKAKQQEFDDWKVYNLKLKLILDKNNKIISIKEIKL
ncbi:hypothetical protein HX096_16345 [Empedobacter falsenii]|uniref:hypothetical protein n=1 Tax=Empedobacter falsenii TaxID=343874 RepID=UPI002574D0D0|nr:hypothetical protein [Empedobacter falsenii]MDM1549425.1 hypothetical protein [Empedobacter falsenii]